MPRCTADATWNGSIRDGEGNIALESGVWSGRYATPDAADATNPEELLAAAQASCFAMTASYVLAESGYAPEQVDVTAAVTLEVTDDRFSIPSVELTVTGVVPDATAEEFDAVVRSVEDACPVSQALAGTEIAITPSLRG